MRKSECKFYVTPDKRTICVYRDQHGTFKGIAKLAEGDTYDKVKGEDIAFLRCKIKEIKYFIKYRKENIDFILKNYYLREMSELERLVDKLWEYEDRVSKLSE